MDDALMAFRRGEIILEACRTRLQRLRQRCRKASARAAELKVEAAGIERLNGDAGYTSAPERAWIRCGRGDTR